MSTSTRAKPEQQPKPFTLWRRTKRWLWRAALAFAGLVLFYVCFLLLGFVPINRGYSVPLADDSVSIFVQSNEIHTDLVLPVREKELGVDWRTLSPPDHFEADVRGDRYVAIGWGDRGFYVDTPTWADLKLSTLCNALFMPSESVLHVEYFPLAVPNEHLHEVKLTRAQYRELVSFVRSTVREVDERGAAKTATDVTYGLSDRFYLSRGSYHLFNTCNQWTGRGLARAGVPVGIWTPLKSQVLYWLP